MGSILNSNKKLNQFIIKYFLNMMCNKIIFRFPINDLLYVINHAYDTIGDVIEVFQVE